MLLIILLSTVFWIALSLWVCFNSHLYSYLITIDILMAFIIYRLATGPQEGGETTALIKRGIRRDNLHFASCAPYVEIRGQYWGTKRHEKDPSQINNGVITFYSFLYVIFILNSSHHFFWNYRFTLFIWLLMAMGPLYTIHVISVYFQAQSSKNDWFWILICIIVSLIYLVTSILQSKTTLEYIFWYIFGYYYLYIIDIIFLSIIIPLYITASDEK